MIKQAIEDTESIGSEETEKLKAEHKKQADGCRERLSAIAGVKPGDYSIPQLCEIIAKRTELLQNANDSLAQQNREYIEGIKNHPTNADMESLVKHNEELRDYLIVKKNELVVKEGIIREKDQKITKMGNTIAEKEAELRELKAAIVNKFLEDNSGL